MKLKKFRGQHLLTDKNMLERIVRESNVKPQDSIIEIGAGTGLLTQLLAENAGQVLSFEIDRDFRDTLTELAGNYNNLTIMITDFLQFDLRGFLAQQQAPWKVVANIPYNITSPIIEKLIEEGRPRITDIYLLVQKEVAQRIVAKPGGKEYGRLSVFAQFFYDCSIMFTVPPDVFTPPPAVDSALLHMRPKATILEVNPAAFFALVQAAFAQRRKTVRNGVKNMLPGLAGEKIDGIFEQAKIDKTRRGETLSLEEFARLTNVADSVRKSSGIAIRREADSE